MIRISDPYTTPAGLIVPRGSVEELIDEALVKAQARIRAEETQTRFFSNFALAQNMVAFGAREKPHGTPHFSMLYEAAKRSFVDSILIQYRRDQMKRIWSRALSDKDLGFKVVHDRHRDDDFEITPEIQRRCDEVEVFLANPTPVEHVEIYPHRVRVHNGLRNLVSILMHAQLAIDRMVLQRYKRSDGKGYAAFHWIPGDTVKNVDEVAKEWARKNEARGKVGRETLYKMSVQSGFDLTQAAYVQLIDGQVQAAYAEDEVSVWITNPSDELNRWGYGVSRLELSLDVTSTLIYAWKFNQEMFKTNYPESVLTVSGDFDKSGLEAFKQQLFGSTGPGNYWRMPVISGGGTSESNAEAFKVEAHKLRDTPKDMLFDTFFRFMILWKCAAYAVHPSAVGFSPDEGGGQHLGGRNMEPEIDVANDAGLRVALGDFCEWLTNDLVKPRYDDLRLIVTGVDVEDEAKVIELRAKRGQWTPRNRLIQEEGGEPIGDMDDPTNPWNYPADAPVSNYITTLNMLQQPGGDGPEDPGQGEPGDPGEKIQKSERRYLRVELSE